jgi:hypothetical protein
MIFHALRPFYLALRACFEEVVSNIHLSSSHYTSSRYAITFWLYGRYALSGKDEFQQMAKGLNVASYVRSSLTPSLFRATYSKDT